MFFRALRIPALVLAAGLAAALGGPLWAQVAPPAVSGAAAPSEPSAAQLLEQGQSLEREQRWGEAITIYEEGVRAYPAREELKQRLSVSRTRFDLARRYNDASYVDGVARMSERDASDLYGEVLLKIQTHHVAAPDWAGLVKNGTRQLEIALSDPALSARLLRGAPAPSADQLGSLVRTLHQEIDARPIAGRQQALDSAARSARLVQRELGLPLASVICEYACGAAAALDEYSGFLTSAQLDDVYSQIEGNFVGIGVELRADQQTLLLVSVIPGSPADRGGMKAGERIVEVEGRTTKDISVDAAADKLKGQQGTLVRVGVMGAGNVVRQLTLRRERVEVSSVENAKIIDREYGVAYFRIGSFQKTTSRDVDAALWQLHRDGMKSLVIDLRGNPGGLLTASVEVADKFLESGTIVSTRGRSPSEDFDYKAHQAGTWGLPVILLIDRDSASASEIFAGAMHDHARASVVGERSYGKGSVQGIFPLNVGGAGVRLTTAKFYSPSGRPISHHGVEPDVQVRRAAKPVLLDDPAAAAAQAVSSGSTVRGEDLVLQTGLQLARQRLSQR